MLVSGYAFCKSDFSVAYQVDDQIVTNYDIDQFKKLSNLLNRSSISRSEVEKIVISNKIKEIYANRLKIVVSNAELNLQVNDFLQSNKIKIKELKSLLRSYAKAKLKYDSGFLFNSRSIILFPSSIADLKSLIFI